MKDVLGIFVAGANGRMGKNIINLVVSDPETRLLGATEHSKSEVQGADAGLNAGTHVTSVTIAADLDRFLQRNRGVIIDFSSVETTLTNLNRAEKYKTPMVIGTTGFTEEQKNKIVETAKKVPIVFAPNMSVAMNLLFKLIEDSAKVLKNGYDIEVFEAHHRGKVDAPSGTATRIANILCEATGRNYKQDVNLHRDGMIGERKKNEIGIQVLRGGDIVGEHTVFFCGMGERLEIRHVASRRRTFAQGAIQAAKWVVNKNPGLYDMQDVLGLKR